MELERMRRTLAEGMGWFKGFGGAYFRITDRELVYAHHEWTPDTDWKQCGMVIEAMREKGWKSLVEDAMLPHEIEQSRLCAAWFHPDDGRHWWAYADAEPYARMLAAARALEATDG